MPEISVLIEGGKATAAAPLGPALGPLGVNIGEIVNSINEKTKDYAGMKVPVKVIIDSATKAFDIEVGSPPTSALIKKEAGIPKGTANPKTEFVADLNMEQVKKIAKMKIDSLGAKNITAAAKEVIGCCDSAGVKVEGKRAKETIKDIEAGKYDSVLQD
jgi:large subunit ribosomal protein L11